MLKKKIDEKNEEKKSKKFYTSNWAVQFIKIEFNEANWFPASNLRV